MSVQPAPQRGALYCPTCEGEWPDGERLCPRDGTRLVRLASDVDPLVGRVLDHRFTIEQKLGEGGMGAVYRARQHSVGRSVAIKVVSPGLVADSLAIKRFLREAKLASQLAHPNIVGVLDFGQTSDGLFYLVMELVQGRTLHDALVSEDRMSLERVVRIGAQICDALEGAHALPIMHRDLKPANVMLLAGHRDHVKILDFGLAKSLANDQSGTAMTSTGALLGTPQFMPPEVAMGQDVDERADLYSLGCMLFMMVAGRPPFVSSAVPEMIAMHGTVEPPRLKGVPRAFADVVARLLRKQPGERYSSAAATRVALEESLRGARAGDAHADTVDEAIAEPPAPVGWSRDTVPSLLDSPRPPAVPVALSSFGGGPPSDDSVTRQRAITPMPGESRAPVATTKPAAPRRRGLAFVLALAILGVGAAIAAFVMRGEPSPGERAAAIPADASDLRVTAVPSVPPDSAVVGGRATVIGSVPPVDGVPVGSPPSPPDAHRREPPRVAPDARPATGARAKLDARPPPDADEPPPF